MGKFGLCVLLLHLSALSVWGQNEAGTCPAPGQPGYTVGCNSKTASMEQFRAKSIGPDDILTTNQGVEIADNQNSLKAGSRGPTLLEDFIMREKITHFDHERIPERVVHARGEGAHGYFQVYSSLANITKAKFLQDPNVQTPVFVRFSTVGGSRGSADTVRDIRGFATKFYTEEGNFDIVGNNAPVFFIQDAIKFPDFVHSVKPEPHNEIPQASSAHDNLWDFVGQQPETMHAIMWLMSDRAIPRSLSMMEGFGVHTFRLINADGVSRFVKFHWKPKLGVHSLVWDEAQKLAGKDSDFNRRELWEDIEAGNFPEWELGLQVVEEGDELKFDFDLLDPTKIIPEELVPVQRVGKMVLNRNPDNFFAETEQVAFCVANIVPGIDFTNDPLMQGRLFSYLDTQLSRLGGPNFHEIPINRPVCPFRNNNQRDAMHRTTINVGKTNYDINTRNNGLPKQAPSGSGFSSYHQQMDGAKLRQRSQSFSDHYSQATLFWQSISQPEQDHLVSAFSFELSKLEADAIRIQVLTNLQNIDAQLAKRVADNLGMPLPPKEQNAYPKPVTPSPALNQATTAKTSIETRRIAILAADGVDGQSVEDIKAWAAENKAKAKVIAPHAGKLRSATGQDIQVDGTIVANPSILFDALLIPGGNQSIKTLQEDGGAVHYALEAYVHYKPIAAAAEGGDFLAHIGLIPRLKHRDLPEGMIVAENVDDGFKQQFYNYIAQHRFFNRQRVKAIPA
ncbi:catalase HPII-like [Paramacrobiotus metropolitanus]|uniref:catalase HPII-like n=1 Tax=Paramacrobiotus metropolitanus TaxID=2943436 RepID=UPI002445AC0A|nr:catalase HPII-like [Paramacrobiotus metropolitanus]XP_055328154.1 catalase HPII-like [Paramacrobiotus metropolitanus]